jgi:hypothetical protein
VVSVQDCFSGTVGACRPRSGRERAFTFCIALLRWNFIVASAMPILPAIWLLKATARDLNHDLALRGALRFEALPGGNERLFVLPSSRLRRR